MAGSTIACADHAAIGKDAGQAPSLNDIRKRIEAFEGRVILASRKIPQMQGQRAAARAG